MNTLIESLLREGLAPVQLVQVEDEGACAGGEGAATGKFKVLVVSGAFQGMGLLDRHRRVNELLAEPLKTIHALQLKTWTPEEYEKKKRGGQ